MLDYAYQNDVILKNPCNKMVKSEIGKQSRKKQALTLGQQKEFCKVAIGNTYEYQYRFFIANRSEDWRDGRFTLVGC